MRQCNFCQMKELRADAIRARDKIITSAEPAGKSFPRGTTVYRVGPRVNREWFRQPDLSPLVGLDPAARWKLRNLQDGLEE